MKIRFNFDGDAPCPYCWRQIERHTPFTGGNGPKHGDVSVCLYCIGLLQFDSELRVVPLPVSELDRMEKVAPEQYEVLRKAIDMLIEGRLKGDRL